MLVKASANSSVLMDPPLRQSNFWKALTRSSSVSVYEKISRWVTADKFRANRKLTSGLSKICVPWPYVWPSFARIVKSRPCQFLSGLRLWSCLQDAHHECLGEETWVTPKRKKEEETVNVSGKLGVVEYTLPVCFPVLRNLCAYVLNLPSTLFSSAASMWSLPPENKLKAARSSCTWSSFKSTDVESRSSPPLLRD